MEIRKIKIEGTTVGIKGCDDCPLGEIFGNVKFRCKITGEESRIGQMRPMEILPECPLERPGTGPFKFVMSV